MTSHNEWKNQGLIRTFSGKIAARDIVNANLKLHGDPRFDELLYIISDFTQLDDFEVNDDIAMIASIDHVATLTNPMLKIAIVATNPELLVWIEKYIIQMEGSVYKCQLFSSQKAAMEWANPYL